MYRVRLSNPQFPSADPGLLTLVDLAGSETTADSQHHDRARLAQTKERSIITYGGIFCWMRITSMRNSI